MNSMLLLALIISKVVGNLVSSGNLYSGQDGKISTPSRDLKSTLSEHPNEAGLNPLEKQEMMKIIQCLSLKSNTVFWGMN